LLIYLYFFYIKVGYNFWYIYGKARIIGTIIII
jgi:hypothetical protein